MEATVNLEAPFVKPFAQADVGVTFSVAYVFAGPERKNDLRSFLQTWADGFKDIELRMREIDTVRGEAADHDLSAPKLQEAFIDEVRCARYDATISTPPCNTFSRVLYANKRGPPPCRSKLYPWGFPWLQGANLRRINKGNELMKFNIAVLNAAASSGTLVSIVFHITLSEACAPT